MRVVLDTNVLVSGALSPSGPCGQIVELAIAGKLQACVDGRILEEYEDLLLHRSRLGIPPAEGRRILEVILSAAERVAAEPLPIRLDDPDDVAFLEVAAAAGVVLVTGNMRHYPVRARASVTVLTPREFLDLLRPPS
ncbi:MAG TPA: putative toxin-antitoxin system toxin component, PIN family [Planctomycetota bacterium]|nr:putative toxin-antitoxin system toxin component, PIN family [Planctomycetota bacterium]HRT94204.1 putative toxin-antitoxin system toxin component, PIN family [Planctomycetota bacterium]